MTFYRIPQPAYAIEIKSGNHGKLISIRIKSPSLVKQFVKEWTVFLLHILKELPMAFPDSQPPFRMVKSTKDL